MKKSVLTYVVLMVVAIIAGYYLSLELTARQEVITPEIGDISNAPVAGFQKIAADVKWMLFVQYLGSLDTIDSKNAPEVAKRLEGIIKFDPNFEPLYKDGAFSLSWGDPAKAIAILEKACGNNYLKSNWQIPFYTGFALSNYAKPADYAQAAKFFRMAAQRAGGSAPYLANSYFRAKAKSLGIPDERLAMLKALYEEWKGQGSSMKDGELGLSLTAAKKEDAPEIGGLVVSDIVERILKASQEAKSPENNPSQELLSFVEKVRGEVLAGQHLCEKCLAPYASGDKFCAKCGAPVKVYGTCRSCHAVLKGDYCSACGLKNKD